MVKIKNRIGITALRLNASVHTICIHACIYLFKYTVKTLKKFDKSVFFFGNMASLTFMVLVNNVIQ